MILRITRGFSAIAELLVISATAEASDFKFGVLLGFSTAHHKNSPNPKQK